MKNGIFVEEDEDGTKKWYKNRKLHRDDGPAIEWATGDRDWYINGECHREDGPAEEFENGTRRWFVHGRLHRTDGPAVEGHDGTYHQWWINGNLHREDGPAVVCELGTKNWYLDGEEPVPPDIFERSLEVCQKCAFFVNSKAKEGWKWRKKYGVSVVMNHKMDSRLECAKCPRILEHTVMV
jgi:hypothetical protein